MLQLRSLFFLALFFAGLRVFHKGYSDIDGVSGILYQILIKHVVEHEKAIKHIAEHDDKDSYNFDNGGISINNPDVYFGYAADRFPLPDWLDEFLKSQPIRTHNQTLADPNEKFIVLACHKFKGIYLEACGGFTDRLFLLPYYIWLAKKTGRRLLM